MEEFGPTCRIAMLDVKPETETAMGQTKPEELSLAGDLNWKQ